MTSEEDEIENEDVYEKQLLGDHVQALKKDELSACVRCAKDVKPEDDYVNLIIFKKIGVSGISHTEFYHLKCWSINDKQ